MYSVSVLVGGKFLCTKMNVDFFVKYYILTEGRQGRSWTLVFCKTVKKNKLSVLSKIVWFHCVTGVYREPPPPPPTPPSLPPTEGC